MNSSAAVEADIHCLAYPLAVLLIQKTIAEGGEVQGRERPRRNGE
jgi:hypothetical protein